MERVRIYLMNLNLLIIIFVFKQNKIFWINQIGLYLRILFFF